MSAAFVLSPRLTGLPVIWDREDGRPDEPDSPIVRERALRLSRGLRAMGVEEGHRVVVLCCREHAEDGQVAVAAANSLGSTAVVPEDWSPASLARLSAPGESPVVHLACEEGVEAWKAARGTGIMIGDGLGVLWWKALECRYAAEELAGP